MFWLFVFLRSGGPQSSSSLFSVAFFQSDFTDTTEVVFLLVAWHWIFRPLYSFSSSWIPSFSDRFSMMNDSCEPVSKRTLADTFPIERIHDKQQSSIFSAHHCRHRRLRGIVLFPICGCNLHLALRCTRLLTAELFCNGAAQCDFAMEA